METQTNATQDWRNEITTPKNTLKVKDGETIEFTFLDEGTKKESKDYGSSIAFRVNSGGSDEKLFYVKSNNFDLLGQIKTLGVLIGLKARITRIGSKRSDTRYKIVKVE